MYVNGTRCQADVYNFAHPLLTHLYGWSTDNFGSTRLAWADRKGRPGQRTPPSREFCTPAVASVRLEPPMPHQATQKPASPSKHVLRYLRRLDKKLLTMDHPRDRRCFLRGEQSRWIARYEAFCDKVDAGRPTSHAVTAWDYLDTILAINRRIITP